LASGFNIRQYQKGKHHSIKESNGKILGIKTLIKPIADKVKAHLRKIGEIGDSHKVVLIKRLNPIINGDISGLGQPLLEGILFLHKSLRAIQSQRGTEQCQ
jgi:hypothetical protein